MVSLAGTSARLDVGRSSGSFLLLALLACAAAFFVASAVDMLGAASLWNHLLRTSAAVTAVVLSYRGWSGAQERERKVRGWATAALVMWLVAELMRLGNVIVGNQPQVGVEPTVVGIGLATAAAFVSATHGRMRIWDEVAIYLDAALVFAATTAVMLLLGGAWAGGPIGLTSLVHASLFLAILTATALLGLATRVPLRLTNQWAILIGLFSGAVGYVGLLALADGPGRTVLHAAVAAGAVIVGVGSSRWSTAEDRRPSYARVADRLRETLPTIGVAVTPVLVVILVARPDVLIEPMRLPVAVSVGLVALLAVARQSVLLRDREQAIHRERLVRADLTTAEAQYRSVVERVPGVVYVAEVGVHGRWLYVSANVTEMLGFTPEEWLADPDMWERQIHPIDHERMVIAESTSLEPTYNGSRWEYRLVARDGREVWVLDDEAVISRDADGRPTTVQGILLDISDRKGLEEQLRHQALHDPLTGLPNRVLFGDRVTHALSRRAGAARVAVLFLDIDDFKTVNDSLGHAVGDELLIRIAERLTAVLRAEDSACRLGGDEFAVLLEDVEADEARVAAERVLAALRPPFSLGGREVTLRGSIGVATRGAAAETAEDLLRDADTAMYAAKSLGKGGIQVFQRGMEQPIMRRLEMRSALELALERGELFVEYQPIIDMRTDELVGLEALARWNHPQLGRVMPADFVPLAEEIGLIGRVGEWVLHTVCSDLADAPDGEPGSSPITASVNVSAHQLGRGMLRDQVASVLAETGMAPGRLVVELTEGTLAAAGEGAEVELADVHALGVRIALDDFGSGYSSLEYLGRLPIDVLKIDRSLVARVDLEPQRQEVLRAVGHVARQLRLETIVEGVERTEQRRVLLELGFRRAQGFLFSRPVSLRQALAYGSRAAA